MAEFDIMTPRELRANHLGKEVRVDGVVLKCHSAKSKMVKTVHYCEKTSKASEKDYVDELALADLDDIETTAKAKIPTVNVVPRRDREGNPLVMEYGLSTFLDCQYIQIQEKPESAPVGQLPRSVDVYLENDLVDCVKPGDRVVVLGVYLPYKKRNSAVYKDKANSFNTVIFAKRRPEFIDADRKGITLSETDQRACQKLVKQKKTAKDLRTYLSSGIAPSLYGLDYEKVALLMLMVGGHELVKGHTRRRGNINVLLVGDPSTGKSQLLRFVQNLAPSTIFTTGRGATGVGLTAAVTFDSDTGDRTLTAGAMVLGDRGIVCIDEFDKMSEIDRVAMHEAMEQGTVSIAKAGMIATLNSRCSVIAAANPLYGKYIPKLKYRNIGLPESLQSRFDLTFILLEHSGDPSYDREVAQFVLTNHSIKSVPKDVPDFKLIGKFVEYASQQKPDMTEEAQQELVEAYAELRKKRREDGSAGTKVVTVRLLESLIRLATAHAKLRLSKLVEREDALFSADLMSYSVDPIPGKKKSKTAKKDKPTEKKEKASEIDTNFTDMVRATLQDIFKTEVQTTVAALLSEVRDLHPHATAIQIRAAVSDILRSEQLQITVDRDDIVYVGA